MKLGLAAISSVCDRLGRPQERLPSVLIGGTNGKGSTAATLSAIARAAGVRAGLYTSPHLMRVTERVRFLEQDISEAELDDLLSRLFHAADAAPEVPLTYFEAMTAAAFLAFAERDLDLAILEVGLGGRFDATNVAPASLSAITSVSLDHVEELGTSLHAIAREKAGIFRRGKPALVHTTSEEALETLRACAEDSGASLHDVAHETSRTGTETGIAGTRFALQTPVRLYAMFTPLPGLHQASNVACAVRASELLAGSFPDLTPEAIRAGVAATRWPGRLESFWVRGRLVLLDGCHNEEGAVAVARSLDAAGFGRAAGLIFGAMADKDIEAIAAALFPAVRRVVVVAVPGPRAASPEELQRRAGPFHEDLSVAESLDGALKRLLSLPGTDPIIVAGSLYLVGEARASLLARMSPTKDEAPVP